MADEKGLTIPAGYDWASLRERSGEDLLNHYVETLTRLGEEKGILGQIFTGALSCFREPVKLKKLIPLIDETEWSALDIDLKGDGYEGLLQKYAAEQKGVGQFFTPRPLIRAIVHCLQPDVHETPDFKVHYPALFSQRAGTRVKRNLLKQLIRQICRNCQKDRSGPELNKSVTDQVISLRTQNVAFYPRKCHICVRQVCISMNWI